jgi:hypothetical protein
VARLPAVARLGLARALTAGPPAADPPDTGPRALARALLADLPTGRLSPGELRELVAVQVELGDPEAALGALAAAWARDPALRADPALRCWSGLAWSQRAARDPDPGGELRARAIAELREALELGAAGWLRARVEAGLRGLGAGEEGRG